MPSFPDFFNIATGNNPYPYQQKLGEKSWPELLCVPTGLGKTAAIIISWLFKRWIGDEDTPRRLVYCLPMRVLVEQTARNARGWIARLCDSGAFDHRTPPSAHVLMGGDIDQDWDGQPERDAILIGTQDQLLSRALNRGYGVSRFRWPVGFGLLNNDAFWVMDEVQLMGSGLATTAQLQAFREGFGTMFPSRSLWMSATLRPDWLRTVDLDPARLTRRDLSEADLTVPSLWKRFSAVKRVEAADIPFKDAAKIAKLTVSRHRPGTLTLVVVNTVKRAQKIYDGLKRTKTPAETILIHSRFRPPERRRLLERLLAEPVGTGLICIATQVVEAGVDVSAATLITDLAPWASLVQRFGRCDRYGLAVDPVVIWLCPDLSKKAETAPYDAEELLTSHRRMETLTDAGPHALPAFQEPFRHGQVIRRKDILELFDTTPDLAGADLDISPYIRETDEHDVQVFWREVGERIEEHAVGRPAREELCAAPIGDIRSIAGARCWIWDHLDRRWTRPANIVPGMTLLLSRKSGGYDKEKGWTGAAGDIPDMVVPTTSISPEGDEDDPFTPSGAWISLANHTDRVCQTLESILSEIPDMPSDLIDGLRTAARWHDAGKAHPVFQEGMVGEELKGPPTDVPWAKTGLDRIAYSRRGFRHELASALAMLQSDESDLAAYLAAAHHGKVRMSIRSLPHETPPPEPDRRFARGVWEGDRMGPADLGGGTAFDALDLDLSPMELGAGPTGESWLSRVLDLLERPDIGPFRLAYLEALVRVADWWGSMEDQPNE